MALPAAAAGLDPLTGLPTRRAWEQALLDTLRGGTRMAVGLIDLDRFARYNDDRGHPAGDDLLVRCARTWGAALREIDTLAQYGGGRFAVLLPRCGTGHAWEVAERLRGAVPDGQTASVGLACWDGLGDPSGLLTRADDALYRAKQSGRDRVVLAPR